MVLLPGSVPTNKATTPTLVVLGQLLAGGAPRTTRAWSYRVGLSHDKNGHKVRGCRIHGHHPGWRMQLPGETRRPARGKRLAQGTCPAEPNGPWVTNLWQAAFHRWGIGIACRTPRWKFPPTSGRGRALKS